MTNKEPNQTTTVANPDEIARRVTLVTGDVGVSPDVELGPDTHQEVFFGLADDRSASTAVVNISRFSKHKTVRNGQEVPEWSGGSYAHIGYYDPVEQKWMLYPEYVLPEEIQAISKELEIQAELGHIMLQAEAEIGMPFVDLRHPLTVQAHKEMSEVLIRTGLASALIDRHPVDHFGNTRRSDDFTTFGFSLTPRLSGPGIGAEACFDEAQRDNPAQYGITYDQNLTVSYRGLILERNKGTSRAKQYVHVASRSMDDEKVWIPDLAVVTTDEWELISHIPTRILDYKKQDPNFSAEHCAVVQHYDR